MVRFSELFTVADYDDCYFSRAYIYENISDFKEGESVRIHTGNPRNYVTKGQIYSVDHSGDIVVGLVAMTFQIPRSLMPLPTIIWIKLV